CNIRGTGEPAYETDFPPGTDMMGEILSGPQSAQRMEFELFSRLSGRYDVPTPSRNGDKLFFPPCAPTHEALSKMHDSQPEDSRERRAALIERTNHKIRGNIAE